MIGKACTSVTPFYDAINKKMSYKSRPCLIIGKADSQDYIILPISRITDSRRINTDYDLPMEPVDYPLLNLTQRSYIRTHKQQVVHINNIRTTIVDFRKEYEDMYLAVITKVAEFQDTVIENAL